MDAVVLETVDRVALVIAWQVAQAIAEEVVQVAVVKKLAPCCMVVYENQLYSKEFYL